MSDRQLIDKMRDDYSCFNIVQLATTRAAELAEFEATVNVLTTNALTGLQRLPVRLRRRAASHRVNRLPRRLHRHHPSSQSEQARLTTKKPVEVKHTKTKCRRFRRRRLRLLAFAARFAASTASINKTSDCPVPSKPRWLPTHLWHTKRFHMITVWGWRLPQAPTNKVFKACQSASLNGCLVFDLSYLSCLEMCGSERDLVNCLQQLVQYSSLAGSACVPINDCGAPRYACEQVGLFLTKPIASDLASSAVERIHHPVLGPVRLLWACPSEPTTRHRHVYLWLHPAMSDEAESLLTECVARYNQACTKDDSVQLYNRTGQVSRLCAIGRQAHQLLADVLVPSESAVKRGDWNLWSELITNCRQASCLPCGTTIFLPDCSDFRTNRPKLKIRNRNWIVAPAERSKDVAPTGVVSAGKLYTWTELRSHQPGSNFRTLFSNCSLCDAENVTDINVLLVQNAAPTLATTYPHCTGWDLILVRSHHLSSTENVLTLRGSLAARDLLISCVYRGAEVGGLRDWQYWSTIGTQGSASMLSYPACLWPDTSGGQDWDAQVATRNQLRYRQVFGMVHPFLFTANSRRPPKLRPDYARFGTSHPFSAPWNELLNRYLPPDDKRCYFVLRDPAVLRLVVQRMVSGEPRARLTIEHLTRYDVALPWALILVRISAVGRGVPKPNATLYAANVDDDLTKDSQVNYAISECDLNQRPVLGYVQTGNFNHAVGHGTGLGYISLAAVATVIQHPNVGPNLTCVWMKNIATTRLRPVRISVVFW
ncbi:hypothetical protein P879_04539 [Paragonimus westermani]|uniref:Uncharacterized protein n=1 Tax=Paragonimus westermani TaxID=34504 RepID=A0A8T0D5G5_9TREM|nr:hypothetical protein P879_04539 [Paragonimus westermani]